tara:strand:+ start:5732 stop:6811 length:1080 start_codon:yes stop_codon:yes gene_type:complete
VKLLFDTCLTATPKGGIERYVHNLAKALCQNNNIYFTTSSKLKNTLFSSAVRMPPIAQFRPARLFGRISSFFIKKELKNNKTDIVHVFNYALNETVKKQLKRTPLVSTVYDLTPEIVGEIPMHTPYHAKKALFDSCTRIISISHSTKKDLIHYYDIDESKIDVIHLATDFPSILEANSSPSKKFVHIGHRAGYKNFEYVAVSFSKILKKQPDISLILIGGGPLTDKEKALLQELDILQAVTCEVSPSDSRIQSILSDSLALLSGSTNEGFGITFLEAMQCGSIPIGSKSSSIPEVLGEAGILVDVENPDAMADAMQILLNNPMYRNSLQKKGLDQAKLFSWQKTAAETFGVYKRCLEAE